MSCAFEQIINTSFANRQSKYVLEQNFYSVIGHMLVNRQITYQCTYVIAVLYEAFGLEGMCRFRILTSFLNDVVDLFESMKLELKPRKR